MYSEEQLLWARVLKEACSKADGKDWGEWGDKGDEVSKHEEHREEQKTSASALPLLAFSQLLLRHPLWSDPSLYFASQ